MILILFFLSVYVVPEKKKYIFSSFSRILHISSRSSLLTIQFHSSVLLVIICLFDLSVSDGRELKFSFNIVG